MLSRHVYFSAACTTLPPSSAIYTIYVLSTKQIYIQVVQTCKSIILSVKHELAALKVLKKLAVNHAPLEGSLAVETGTADCKRNSKSTSHDLFWFVVCHNRQTKGLYYLLNSRLATFFLIYEPTSTNNIF